jgi:class 3 adenylate cyclase/pimeloyl-ACP methyl ester carboxylesterase
MREPRVQYVTTADGVSIAYAVTGSGYPVVYLPGPPFNHIQQEWLFDNYRLYSEAIGYGRQLVLFDSRGSGLSDRRIADFTLERLTLDLQAVVDHVGLDRFILVGTQAGGPIALTYTAGNPSRVNQLVLVDSYPSGEMFTSIPQVRGFLALMQSDWTLFTESLAHFFYGWDAGEPARRYAEFLRSCVDAEQGVAFFNAVLQWDVTTLLSTITNPTSVLQHTGSVLPNVEMARFLASRLPNAELLLLEGWWNDPNDDAQVLGDTLARILGSRPQPRRAVTDAPAEVPITPTPSTAGGLVTILFTDIEGSTALTQRLGDVKARDVFREHERITREALRQFGGSEVKTMGDGFMASFVSATQALQCAIAMQRAFTAHNQTSETSLNVRIGLNTGEPIVEEQDLFGTAVITAARIAAQARGGEILASNVLRELVAGRGFVFADRGETILRGFEDPVRIYELSWQE